MKSDNRFKVVSLIMLVAMVIAAFPALTDAARPENVANAQNISVNVFLPMVNKLEVDSLAPFSVQIAGLSQITTTLSLNPAFANLSPAAMAEAKAQLETELEAAFPTMVEAIKQSGAGYARVYIDWTAIQPSESGAYNWRFYDLRLPQLDKAGIGIIATINNAPLWAKVNDDVCGVIGDKQAYYQFLRDLAMRYPYIDVWEILNEPDAVEGYRCGAGVQNYGNAGAEYASLLQGAYTLLKTLAPHSDVIMGGMAYDSFVDQGQNVHFNRYFLDEVIKAGGAQYMDGINYHYFKNYAGGWESWTNGDGKPTCLGAINVMDEGDTFYYPYGFDITSKASHLDERLKVCFGVENMPQWLSETGANGIGPTNPDFAKTQDQNSHFFGATLEDQARYVFTVHARGFAAGAENITWYAIKIVPELTMLDHQGLLYDSRDPSLDNQPKPAFHAYQTMTRELGDYHFEKWVTFDPKTRPAAEAYQFQHKAGIMGGKAKIVAWSNSGSQPLTLAATAIRVVSRPDNGVFPAEFGVTDGSALDADGAVNGSITFNLSIEPVIIEIVQ